VSNLHHYEDFLVITEIYMEKPVKSLMILPEKPCHFGKYYKIWNKHVESTTKNAEY
jgi:hypothetical protein